MGFYRGVVSLPLLGSLRRIHVLGLRDILTTAHMSPVLGYLRPSVRSQPYFHWVDPLHETPQNPNTHNRPQGSPMAQQMGPNSLTGLRGVQNRPSYYIILYYTVIFFTILYHTILYYTILYYIIGLLSTLWLFWRRQQQGRPRVERSHGGFQGWTASSGAWKGFPYRYRLPGKPAACNSGPHSMTCGLLSGKVAHYLGYLAFQVLQLRLA